MKQLLLIIPMLSLFGKANCQEAKYDCPPSGIPQDSIEFFTGVSMDYFINKPLANLMDSLDLWNNGVFFRPAEEGGATNFFFLFFKNDNESFVVTVDLNNWVELANRDFISVDDPMSKSLKYVKDENVNCIRVSEAKLPRSEWLQRFQQK